MVEAVVLFVIMAWGYGCGKAGEAVGAAIGKSRNSKRLGKYSPFNEITTVRQGKDCRKNL